MPIKWSAVKVNEAMDGVEAQVILADQFIAEAKARANEAKKIPNLPEYMVGRLSSLTDQLKRIDYVKEAITSVRKSIPDGAIEAERERIKHGSTQSLL